MTNEADAPVGLVVPMYDEEARLAEYGKQLLDFIVEQPQGSELVLVDDGSDDGTVALAEELIASVGGAPARVLREPHRGKGATVTAGLHRVEQEVVAFCDLDLSTPLDDLQRIVDAARRVPVLAIGSRDLPASQLVRPESAWRELLGRTYNRLLQATVTPGVVDTQCGAKAARRAIWDRVLPHCREAGFAWDAELIAIALADGIEVLEVPVAWRHDERSHVHVGRDGLAMVLATARIRRRAVEVRKARPARRETAVPVEVFDDENAAQLAAADRSHWWFRSKAALVATALRRTDIERGGWLVDAGGGAGGVTAMLGWSPDRTLVVEGNGLLAGAARTRYGFASIQGGLGHVPLADGTASVVCLLDVIEHVTDPVAVLRDARRVLTDDGVVVVNVPAHQWLWSEADVALGHHRRYDRAMLRSQLAAAELEPLFVTHVFSWLVPPVWLKRRLAPAGRAELGLDQTSTIIDRAAMALTTIERATLTHIAVPLGTSILCVARPGR